MTATLGMCLPFAVVRPILYEPTARQRTEWGLKQFGGLSASKTCMRNRTRSEMGREPWPHQDERTDAELVAAAGRDADAFHGLYERYATKMYSYFERRTRSRDASLDLTSETFARAWLSRTGFRDLAGGSAAPWLFAIARRVLIASVEKRRLESEARRRLGMLVEREPTLPEPEQTWLDDLTDGMEALPASQRQAVELRVLHDMSYGQIAARLRCSQGAARIRVSRGLAALRHSIEGEAL